MTEVKSLVIVFVVLKFVLYTTIGSIPWTFAFVYVGYTLGNNWVVLKEYVSKFKGPILILILIYIIYYFYKKGKTKRNSNEYS